MAADLRRGEHIPKMQNNIGCKSMHRVLRQLRSKDGGGGGVAGCRTVPGHAARCSAWCCVLHNCLEFTPDQIRQIRQRQRQKPQWAQTDFLQVSNLPLYQLRHTSHVNNFILDTIFTILYSLLYYTILYYNNYTLLKY